MTIKPVVPVALGFALAVAAIGASTPVAAHLVTISGSGIWGANAPTTPYSVAGQSYSFRFKVEKTIPVAYQDADTTLTTTFQAYQFKRNGFAVPGTPDDIAFFDSALGGGFVLAYADYSVEFLGPDIGSSGTITLGNYSFYPNIDYVATGGVVINEGTSLTTVVPEPASWTLSLVGFGAAGGMLRSRRRATTPAG